jgi:hypothetical protein
MSFSDGTNGVHTKSSSLKGPRGGCCVLSWNPSMRYVWCAQKNVGSNSCSSSFISCSLQSKQKLTLLNTLLHGLRWRIHMRTLNFLGLPWDWCAPRSWRYNYYIFLTLVYSHYQCRHTQSLTHALTTMIPDVHTWRTMHQSFNTYNWGNEMACHDIQERSKLEKVCI